MNKNTIIVSSVIVLVLIVVGMSVYKKDKDAAMMTQEGNQVNSMMEKEMVKEDAMMDGKGDTMMNKEMEKDTMMNKDTMMQNGESVMDKKEDTMMKSGSYEAYSAEKVAMASDTHDVVLFFRASWCPSCITVDKDIKANLSKIPANLTILDVNYDNSTELKKKYGVTYQHTFVQVSKDGSLIKKWSGSPTLASLVSEVK